MLHLIKDITDGFFSLLSQDPVRPHIPHHSRIGENKDIFVSRDENQKVKAIMCASYQSTVPVDESQLFEYSESPHIVIFYTIWSYEPGAGRELIFESRSWIMQNKPEITRYMTLSPPTQMARKFHLNNGATVYRINQTSVNYEYV